MPEWLIGALASAPIWAFGGFLLCSILAAGKEKTNEQIKQGRDSE